jgi:hypothetical protein
VSGNTCCSVYTQTARQCSTPFTQCTWPDKCSSTLRGALAIVSSGSDALVPEPPACSIIGREFQSRWLGTFHYSPELINISRTCIFLNWEQPTEEACTCTGDRFLSLATTTEQCLLGDLLYYPQTLIRFIHLHTVLPALTQTQFLTHSLP